MRKWQEVTCSGSTHLLVTIPNGTNCRLTRLSYFYPPINNRRSLLQQTIANFPQSEVVSSLNPSSHTHQFVLAKIFRCDSLGSQKIRRTAGEICIRFTCNHLLKFAYSSQLLGDCFSEWRNMFLTKLIEYVKRLIICAITLCTARF